MPSAKDKRTAIKLDINYQKCDEAMVSSVSCLEGFTLQINNNEIEFIGQVLSINGRKYDTLPYSLFGIYIKEATSEFFMIQTSFLRILYKPNSQIYIDADAIYSNKVRK